MVIILFQNKSSEPDYRHKMLRHTLQLLMVLLVALEIGVYADSSQQIPGVCGMTREEIQYYHKKYLQR